MSQPISSPNSFGLARQKSEGISQKSEHHEDASSTSDVAGITDRFVAVMEKTLSKQGIPYESTWAWGGAMRELIADHGHETVAAVLKFWSQSDFWPERSRSPAKLAQHWPSIAHQAKRDGFLRPANSSSDHDRYAEWDRKSPALRRYHERSFVVSIDENGEEVHTFTAPEEVDQILDDYHHEHFGGTR